MRLTHASRADHTPVTAIHSSARQALIQAWPPGFDNEFTATEWVVVHSKPRQEKCLARDAQHLGIRGCLFLERRVRTYPGKGTQISFVPLLGPYVFLALDRDVRESLYRTERCVRLIEVRQPAILTADLQALKRLFQAAIGPIQVRPEIVPGQRVLIRSGVFAGCTALVTKRKGLAELVVNLTALGTSVSTTLPAEWAELAQPA
jgi:transcription antitermination factor NusG